MSSQQVSAASQSRPVFLPMANQDRAQVQRFGRQAKTCVLNGVALDVIQAGAQEQTTHCHCHSRRRGRVLPKRRSFRIRWKGQPGRPRRRSGSPDRGRLPAPLPRADRNRGPERRGGGARRAWRVPWRRPRARRGSSAGRRSRRRGPRSAAGGAQRCRGSAGGPAARWRRARADRRRHGRSGAAADRLRTLPPPAR